MRFCITIRGKVQGVFFRKYVHERAKQLNINGFVENHADGSVYCEAEGPKENLEIFIDLCSEGSPLSRVASVEVETLEPLHFKGFEIRK